MTEIGPVAQQGVVSTQLQRVQTETAVAPEAAQRAEASPPPPPPPEEGRGATIDTTA